jgi:hypothetical protein
MTPSLDVETVSRAAASSDKTILTVPKWREMVFQLGSIVASDATECDKESAKSSSIEQCVMEFRQLSILFRRRLRACFSTASKHVCSQLLIVGRCC